MGSKIVMVIVLVMGTDAGARAHSWYLAKICDSINGCEPAGCDSGDTPASLLQRVGVNTGTIHEGHDGDVNVITCTLYGNMTYTFFRTKEACLAHMPSKTREQKEEEQKQEDLRKYN